MIWYPLLVCSGKESTCNVGDPGLIPGLGSSPGEGIGYPLQYSGASPVAQTTKNLPAMWETWFNPWTEKIPWRRAWQPTSVFLSGESPWTDESLAGYSPWDGKESDATERISTAQTSIQYILVVLFVHCATKKILPHIYKCPF